MRRNQLFPEGIAPFWAVSGSDSGLPQPFWWAEADEFKEMFRCSRDCSFKDGPGRLIGTLCN